jgi:long-subunit fatty acid transport protein
MVPRSILVVALAASSPAGASPRSDPTIGRAVFTGAKVPSATSISLNPAALGLGKTSELYVSAAAVLEQLGVDRRVIDAATNTLVDGPRASDVQLGPGGSIAYMFQAGDRIRLGVEARLPPPEMFPDHPALRYHALGSRQRNYVVTGGASLRLSNKVYIGASVSHDTKRLRLRYARDTAIGTDGGADCGGTPCGHEHPLAEQRYEIDVRSGYVSGENVNINLGVLVQIFRDTWLGLAYHNTPGFGIQTQLDGTMAVTRAPREGGGVVRGGSTVYVSYPASVDGELRTRIHPRFELHVGGRWEDLSRMQAYDVRGYGSAFRGEDIPEWTLRPRGFRDAFALWGGIQQVDVGERWTLGGRIGLETSAQPPSRTAPGSVSPTSVTLDAGAQLRLSPSLMLQLSYGVQLFQRVSAETSDYDPRFVDQCAASGFDYTTRACAAVRSGYAIPTAAGDYARIQHALRLGLRYEIQ